VHEGTHASWGRWWHQMGEWTEYDTYRVHSPHLMHPPAQPPLHSFRSFPGFLLFGSNPEQPPP
jgi:hypothetical protein